MRTTFCMMLVSLVLVTSSCDYSGNDQKETPGWKLVWSDEFNYSGCPDPKKWTAETGGHGWGNNELQYYTDKIENAKVENGVLKIIALKNPYGNNSWTSARLVTNQKGDWTYGRIVVRAKIPSGKGTWSAIWMLPSIRNDGNNSWPDNGEIDIMEHVGKIPGRIHYSALTKDYNHAIGTQKIHSTVISDCSTAFHDYSIEWGPEKIDFYIDRSDNSPLPYFTFINEHLGWTKWPFYKNFHLVLNVAIGGSWGGEKLIPGFLLLQWKLIMFVFINTKNKFTIAF